MRRPRRPTGGLWNHADFLKLWTGQTISEFGSQVSQLAIPWVALVTLNASAFEVAPLGTVEFLPFVLFTLPAGVWVDRLRRRSILIVGDFGRALLLISIPIAYALGDLTLAQLYVVGFLVGICTVFFDVAYQSYLPSLVDRDSLIEGNSKLNVTRSGAQVAGPGAAGGLIALDDGAVRDPRRRDQLRRVGAASRSGSGSTRKSRSSGSSSGTCSSSCGKACATCSATGSLPHGDVDRNLQLLLEPSVRDPDRVRAPSPRMSSGLIGLSFSLAAIGWMIGAAQARPLSPLARRRRRDDPRSVSCAAQGRCSFHSHHAAFRCRSSSRAARSWASASVVYNIQQVSLRQAISPARLQGRMNASMRCLVWGTMPLGSLTGGAIAAAAGLRTAIFVGAIGGFTSILPIALLADPLAPRVPRGRGGSAAPARSGDGRRARRFPRGRRCDVPALP